MDDGWMDDGWVMDGCCLLIYGRWRLLALGGVEQARAGSLGCSLPRVLPCFHLVQIGRRMEITSELSRFVLGKEGVDASSISDKTELFRQTLAELTSSCSPTR